MTPAADSQKLYQSNQYTAQSACGHCAGVIRHEPWCITRNRAVAYAWESVLDAGKLSVEDRLILHALGVAWIQFS
ncbi:MAG TPA: hypothetical protein VL240_12000 [Candidatus Binatia bacterium]|nr:hypothetical protein [Candidatus Binatia bacterium]